MFSLVLPVRDWPMERINLCIESFLHLSSTFLTEILVVDFGSDVAVQLDARSSEIASIKVVRLEAGAWSSGEATNAGVVSAANDYILKADADILISRTALEAFDRWAGKIVSGAVGLAIAQAIDLDRTFDPASAARAVRRGRQDMGRLRAKWGQGGLVAFSRATWDHVGGYEARFTGWGNEDNDFAERVRLSGRRVEWMEREQVRIYHIWHPPTYAARSVVGQRMVNQKLAASDRSILRSANFPNSNFSAISAPAILERVSPLVTVAIATTARPNRQRMIIEAIKSFHAQSEQDFEIVVVDNGSPADDRERLRKTLASLSGHRAIVYEAVDTASIPAARNAITDLARGRYICVADDDDIALPDRLRDHLLVLRADGLAHGSHGGWIDFDEASGVMEFNQGKKRSIATLLKGTGKITAHPATFLRTDVLRAVRYDESISLGSDWDLALRLANLGFDIPHTRSYLILRRFHASNVTITDQSSQVSNGLRSRGRTIASFALKAAEGLAGAAARADERIYCRNNPSLESLTKYLPRYCGVWNLYIPLGALSPTRREHVGTLEEPSDPIDADTPSKAAPISFDTALLDEPLAGVLKTIDGDICMRRSGLDQPIFFRSAAIKGMQKAIGVKQAIENTIRFPVELCAAQTSDMERRTPFDWPALAAEPGRRLLLSERIDNLPDVLHALGKVGEKSLLHGILSILSDFDEFGEAYYLLTAPVKGHHAVRELIFELQLWTHLGFSAVAAGGIRSDLAL